MKLAKIGSVRFSLLGILNGFIFSIFAVFYSEGFAETIAQGNDSIEQYRKLFIEQQREFEKQRRIIAEQGKQLQILKARLYRIRRTRESRRPSKRRPSLL
jgi:hypothetical protein